MSREQEDVYVQQVVDLLLEANDPPALQVGAYRRNFASHAHRLLRPDLLQSALNQVDPQGEVFEPLSRSAGNWHKLLLYVTDKLGPEHLAFIDGQVAALDQFNVCELSSLAKQCTYPYIFRSPLPKYHF